MKSIIFALFLVGFDATGSDDGNELNYSPANPVQWWHVGCQTFNQKEVCGIFHRCWYQPWNCDDNIINQFWDVFTDDSNFQPTSFASLSTLLSRTTTGPLIDWTPGATPSVSNGSAYQSEIGYIPFDFIPGIRYRITTTFTGVISLDGAANIRIRAYDSAFNVLASGSASLVNSAAGQTVSIDFASSEETAYIGFVVTSGLPSLVTLTSISAETPTPDEYAIQILDENGDEIDQIALDSYVVYGTYDTIVVYQNSFVPSYLNICDEKISLKLLKLTGSPDEDVLLSDGLDIATEHKCTNLIEYSNNRNYAGLIYDSVSPATTFNIRVRSVFYDEELPQEDFVMELPTGVEKTGSVLTAQRLLQIDSVPDYYHLKLAAVLNHQTVLIDGSYWVKSEKYEKTEKSNKRQPMRKASVLLTQRDLMLRANL